MAGFPIHRKRLKTCFMNAVRMPKAARMPNAVRTLNARVLNTARMPNAARMLHVVRMLHRAVACGLLILGFSGDPAYSQSPATGPFMQRDQFPVRMLFLGLRPETGDLLPRRSIRTPEC